VAYEKVKPTYMYLKLLGIRPAPLSNGHLFAGVHWLGLEAVYTPPNAEAKNTCLYPHSLFSSTFSWRDA